jgi:hypothetical protein
MCRGRFWPCPFAITIDARVNGRTGTVRGRRTGHRHGVAARRLTTATAIRITKCIAGNRWGASLSIVTIMGTETTGLKIMEIMATMGTTAARDSMITASVRQII